MKLVVPSSRRSVRRALEAASAADPTYDPDGSHDGLAELRVARVVGRGEADLAAAAEGLVQLATHRVLGVRVLPAGLRAAVGATCVVTLGTPLLAVAAPCRVTEASVTSSVASVAYRTLPGHPELGEESFTASLEADGTVRLVVLARSRPADGASRLVAPLTRRLQRLVAGAYARALARHVAAARCGPMGSGAEGVDRGEVGP